MASTSVYIIKRSLNVVIQVRVTCNFTCPSFKPLAFAKHLIIGLMTFHFLSFKLDVNSKKMYPLLGNGSIKTRPKMTQSK